MNKKKTLILGEEASGSKVKITEGSVQTDVLTLPKKRCSTDDLQPIKYQCMDSSFAHFLTYKASEDGNSINTMSEENTDYQPKSPKRLAIFKSPILTQQDVCDNLSLTSSNRSPFKSPTQLRKSLLALEREQSERERFLDLLDDQWREKKQQGSVSKKDLAPTEPAPNASRGISLEQVKEMARSIKKYCRMIRNLWSGTESKPPESPPQNIQIQDTQESPPESIEIQDIQESPPEGTQIPDTSEVKEEAENVDHEMEQAEPTTSPLNPQTSLNQCSILFEDDNIKNSTRMSETKNQERKPVLKHPLKKFKKAKIQRLKFEKFWMDRYNNGAVKDNKVAKEQKVEHLPLTREHFERFIQLAEGPNRETLVTKFSLAVSRKEIKILLNGMWLNDMIINFYMNLLTERSENKAGQLPSVYAMNTFFLPLLLKKGHEGVKRWTRKTDLFSKDIIPVPVHCGDVHWCMAIIHMRDKSILYYDSIGKGNQPVLDALKIYIQEESMHKRNLPFNISGFRIEKAKHMPRQTNSNDCGVFSCMVAEFITRDAPLNFTQSDMDYFRRKMALEILDAKLWL